MAKPTLKNEDTLAAAPATDATAATPATPATAKRAGGKKLVQKTPNELVELIGGDTKIGVSLKELVAVHTKNARAAATKELLG